MDAPPPADESHPAEYFSTSDLTAKYREVDLIFIGYCISLFIVVWIVIMVLERICGRPNTLDRGLDSRPFSALPVITYKKSDSGRILECSICLENFEDGESVRVMPVCKHIFHKDCIDKWLRDHVTCPVCRAVIESSEPGPKLAPPSEATSEPSSSISDYVSLSISINESGSVSRMASVQSTPESMVASTAQPVRHVHDMV